MGNFEVVKDWGKPIPGISSPLEYLDAALLPDHKGDGMKFLGGGLLGESALRSGETIHWQMVILHGDRHVNSY